MAKSTIEWTEHTWNPIVSGCSIISEGCTNCYAMQMANRLEAMGQEKYKGLTRKTAKGKIVWTGKININLDDKALYEPLHRKKPTMYFVNSMTDLFHEEVPFEAIDKIMAVIALCPQHTFQLLTKRADRMYEYFTCDRDEVDSFSKIMTLIDIYIEDVPKEHQSKYDILQSKAHESIAKFGYLPNLWNGVSIENQEQADKRIPYLLETPAKVRFLSIEPLLGSIDLNRGTLNVLKKIPPPTIEGFVNSPISTIDWVIVGGESGHHARPMHPDWVRSIKNQCQEAGVPFFFKQFSSNNNKDYKCYEKFPKDLQIRELPRS